MRVKLQLSQDPIWIHPLGTPAFTQAAAEAGIHIVDDHPDLTFAVASTLTEPPKTPTLIFEQLDTSKPTRDATRWENENVVGYALPAVTEGLSQSDVLYHLDGTDKPVYFFTTMLWHQLQYVTRPAPVEKDIDVMFAGSIAHENSYVRSTRRDLAAQWFDATRGLNAVGIFHGANPMDVPRPLNTQQHLELMNRTKVAVCPPGNLELCWRDYEAALCGCIKVKPVQAALSCFMNPWQFTDTIFCQPSYSDLGDRIMDALERWNERRSTLQADADTYWRVGGDLFKLAQRFRNLCRDAIANVSSPSSKNAARAGL